MINREQYKVICDLVRDGRRYRDHVSVPMTAKETVDVADSLIVLGYNVGLNIHEIADIMDGL